MHVHMYSVYCTIELTEIHLTGYILKLMSRNSHSTLANSIDQMIGTLQY